MEKIRIFYHFYACCAEYRLWLDEQLGFVRDSGLSQLSLVDICISYTDAVNVEEVRDHIYAHFSDVVCNVKIFPKDCNEYFEGVTLNEVYKFSCKHDGYKILYFHSKGISKVSPDSKIPFDKSKFPYESLYERRQYAQVFCIKNHIRRIKELDRHNVTAPYFEQWPVPHFECNFWWANSSYIKTLQPPLNKGRYFAKIKWESLGKFTAWRVQRIKNPILMFTRWGRSSAQFWICNNAVLPDGTIVSKMPKIKLSTMWYDMHVLYLKFRRLLKELLFYLLGRNNIYLYYMDRPLIR